MKNMKQWMMLAMVVVVAAAMVGCETYGQSAGLGAALGAGTGAVIGHQSGRAAEGAAIGAIVGGLAGLVVHDIRVRQAQTAQQTAEEYQYVPAQGERLMLERVDVMPQIVRPGQQVEVSVQYAILGTGGGVQVREQRALLRNGQVLREVSSEVHTRTDGTWVSAQEIRLPGDLPPATYTFQVRVTTNQSTVSGMGNFTVE